MSKQKPDLPIAPGAVRTNRIKHDYEPNYTPVYNALMKRHKLTEPTEMTLGGLTFYCNPTSERVLFGRKRIESEHVLIEDSDGPIAMLCKTGGVTIRGLGERHTELLQLINDT